MDDFTSDAPLQPKKDKVRIKIRREEREYFPKLFDSAKTKGTNKVSGDGAVLFFRKSRLSPEMLGKIWSLAAQTNNAFMDRDEFYVALRLVALAQARREVSLNAVVQNADSPLPYFDGIPMPKVAPPANPSPSMMGSEDMMNPGMMNAAMMNAAMMGTGMMNPGMMNPGMMSPGMMNAAMGNIGMMNAGIATGLGTDMSSVMNAGMSSGMMGGMGMVEKKASPYAITQQEADKYSRIYDALDKGRVGSITADQMTLLLKKTRLPDEVLGQVWELADVDENGNFDKLNVIIVLHLLIKHKAGIAIPQSVPPDLKSAIEGFLQGKPILPPVAQSPMPTPVPLSVPAIMPAMPVPSNPNDPFAEIENPQPFAGMPGMYSFPGMAAGLQTGGGGEGTSEGLKSALRELQTLNPEKERLKSSIAMYRETLAKEEEILNNQIAAFRDVAAEYNEMLKKVSGGRETGNYGATNGASKGGANWGSGNDGPAFDFS